MTLNDSCKFSQASQQTTAEDRTKLFKNQRTASDTKAAFSGLENARLLWMLALVCLLAGTSVQAQTARLAGQLTSFGSSLTNAVGIAVDGSLNAYVVTSSGTVYKETYSSTAGTYTEASLFTTASASASDITVDSAGANIYVGTGSGHTVVQYTGSGTSYALGTTFSGFTGNTAPAVDTAGNVYIADAGSNSLYKETLSGTTFSKATIATGFTSPSAITIDASGTPFVVSGTSTNAVYKISGTGTTYTKSALSITGLSGITGIAVDGNDDLFFQGATDAYEAVLNGTTYTNGFFYQYSGSALAVDTQGSVYLASATQASGTKILPGAGYLNFGSVGPGTPPTMTIAFTVTTSSSTLLGMPTVVTQGLTGYDFTLGTAAPAPGPHQWRATAARWSCSFRHRPPDPVWVQ